MHGVAETLGPQTEKTVELRNFKAWQKKGMLPCGETGKRCQQLRLRGAALKMKGRDDRGMEAIAPGDPGEFGQTVRIDMGYSRLRDKLPGCGLTAKPAAALLPQGRIFGGSVINGVSHRQKVLMEARITDNLHTAGNSSMILPSLYARLFKLPL